MPRARDVEQKDRPIHTLPAAWRSEYLADKPRKVWKNAGARTGNTEIVPPRRSRASGHSASRFVPKPRRSSRYEAVREKSKRMVERPAKDVSEADPNRGTLETPGPWRPEWLKNAVGVHRSMKTSRMRWLTLACTSGTVCVIFGADATDLPVCQSRVCSLCRFRAGCVGCDA